MICALFFVHCASESPPGGGPPDTTSPVALFLSISSGATNVDSMQTLRIEFSEPLNSKTLAKNITIFPLGEYDTDIRMQGKKLSITPNTPWKKNVVYTVILGKNISDLRNNHLSEPIHISFTTDSHIPQNSFRGSIANLKDNLSAVIYISRKTAYPDSIISAPEYYTQSGPGGSFSFDYLPRDTFYIAGYIDLDKSNNYKATFDGVCIPSKIHIVPDTLAQESLVVQAVYDNFFNPRLLRAESIYPGATRLEFTKAPAVWNVPGSFQIENVRIDTVIYDEKTCVLYHDAIQKDSLTLSLHAIRDYLSCMLKDTLLTIPVTALADTLYQFEQKGDQLFITPPPGAAELTGRFESSLDTLKLTLNQLCHGIYDILPATAFTHGKWNIRMPVPAGYSNINTDSVYTVLMQRAAKSEFGAVIGYISAPISEVCRMVLEDGMHRYEITCEKQQFNFMQVLPGNYTLSYYLDANNNGRADYGRPYPYRTPEIIHVLDTGIQVKSRWDTELSEVYKIDIENQ